ISETNTYYENRGETEFEDATAASGVGLPSIPYTGFGDAFTDLDNDGDLDLVVVNGAVKRRPASIDPSDSSFWSGYAEPNLVLENLGDGTFADISDELEGWSDVVEVSRGLVPADFDDDGDLDLLITQFEGPVRLWRNEGGNAMSWLHVRTLDPKLGRETPGAQVRVRIGDRELLRLVEASSGYLTSGPGGAWFGLGAADRFDSIEVRWPDGSREGFPGGEARRRVTLRRGEGS
ncbi:MAG: FG-GAP-like repeat-containing protein, partial [Thermoanaerobaculia bacterium]|nr:FG-GAP-like repeat-containing protein [Thermoanaerobaculia bacterium]